MFILVAPQNAVGNCIIDVRTPIYNIHINPKLYDLPPKENHSFHADYIVVQDLRAMTDAAGSRPVILINPRLKVKSPAIFISIFTNTFEEL